MTEMQLLEWLSKEDWSAYGECCGRVLDSLLARGLVRLSRSPPTGMTGVCLSEAGWSALKGAEA